MNSPQEVLRILTRMRAEGMVVPKGQPTPKPVKQADGSYKGSFVIHQEDLVRMAALASKQIAEEYAMAKETMAQLVL